MAGRVFYRDGARHLSRETRHVTLIPGKDGFPCWAEVNHALRVKAAVAGVELRHALVLLMGRFIPHQEFRFLVRSIAIARTENELQTKARATRKDALAQLKDMKRLADDDLLDALQGCDRMTFEAIWQAQTDAISEILWRDGVFVDAAGEEHRIPPDIELGVSPYLPMGIQGVRNAMAVALQRIESDAVHEESNPSLRAVTWRTRIHPKVGAGRVAKPYQLDLARACWALYPDGKPWRTSGTGIRSKLVDLADIIFKAAGMNLGNSRLVALLESSEPPPARWKLRRFLGRWWMLRRIDGRWRVVKSSPEQSK